MSKNYNKIIIMFCLGILTSLYIVRFFSVTIAPIVLFALITFVLQFIFSRMILICAVFIGMLFGIMRAQPLLQDYSMLTSYFDKHITITGRVVSDPVYHESGQYEFFLETSSIENRAIQAIIRVRAYAYDFSRGDALTVSSKLRDGFAYWQGSMYYADAQTLKRDESTISTFRKNFITNTYNSVSDPEASLGLGFLIGIRSLLPETLVQQLQVTGLSHIVAVSGYNLTILVNMCRRLLMRFSRFQALCLSLMLLCSFVLVTGLSPSILRAMIVSFISLTAWYFGREASPWQLLLYSSVISAYIRPDYIWFNIGWYLSFFAFVGVLVIAPIIHKKFFRNAPKLIGQVFLETTSAQLLTLPIIMFVFGKVSIISLLANVVVLPLIPLAMVLTALVGFLGFVSWHLAALCAMPCFLLLHFIVQAINRMADANWALAEITISMNQLVLFYLLIALLTYILYRRASGETDTKLAKFGIISDRK